MAERTKEFVENIKIRQVPTGYQMILLDDKSRSTNVLLDRTIEMILEITKENGNVYYKKRIE